MGGSDAARVMELGSNYLEHYGVKGMKWGVRRADSGSGPSPRQAKKIAKKDAKFEKRATSDKVFFQVYNGAASRMNKQIDAINNKPEYQGKDFTQPSKIRDKYYKDVEDAFNNALRESAKSLGTNASGTRRLGIKIDKKNGNWDVTTEEVKHAVQDVPILVIPNYDDNGYVLSVEIGKPVLKHYGVKGMKWGVRRADTSSGGSSSKATVSDDAKAANEARAKIKSGGTQTLSNKELQGLVSRMNLESQYKNLSSQEVGRGMKATGKILKYGKTAEDIRKFLQTPTGKAVKTGLKVAATAGAAYATGGTSAAAKAGGVVVVRRAANHYTNVGR